MDDDPDDCDRERVDDSATMTDEELADELLSWAESLPDDRADYLRPGMCWEQKKLLRLAARRLKKKPKKR